MLAISLRRLAILVTASCSAMIACSAGSGDHAGKGGQVSNKESGTGGSAIQVSESETSTGGDGGTNDTLQEEVTHPLFGAGNYPNTPPTDPCLLAQHWEESTNMDLTTGALVLKDGVVYEISGVGRGESTWADEWTAPPCTRADGHCEDLAYQVVATCD